MFNTFFSRIMSITPVRRQSIISLFWQVVFTAIGFVSTMYFAHTVGAAVLGAYFLFVAYNSIFGMVTDGGFGGAAVKRISEGEEPDVYFSAYFVLRSIFTVVVVLGLLVFRDSFVDLNTSGLFIWLLLAIIVSLFTSPVASGIAGSGKMGIRTTCAAIGNISRIVIQVVAIFLGYKAAGLVGGAVAGILISAIIEFRFFDLRMVRFKWQHIKSLSTFSFWLFLTSGGVLVFSQADTVLIGYYLGNFDVGIYRVILQFTAVATFVTYALRTTLWPRVSRWGKSGEINLVEESLARALSYSLVLAVPVLVGGVLVGDKLLYFFYGADFALGYTTLIILLVVQVVNVFQYFFTMYLDALNYPKESFKVTIVAVVINIALNIILIPMVGIVGAAVATLVTMTLSVVLARHVLSCIIKIHIECSTLLSIMKASVVMAVFLVSYRLFVPLSIVWLVLIPVVVSMVMYSVLLLKFDRKICDELCEIVEGMGMRWPQWL